MPDAADARGSGLPEQQLSALRDALDAQPMLCTLSGLMNAAGNETRLRILFILWRGDEVRVNDLAAILGLTTPAVSQQLKKLRRHTLVQTRRDAQTVYYRLNAEHGFIGCLTWIFREGAFPPMDLYRGTPEALPDRWRQRPHRTAPGDAKNLPGTEG